VALLNVLEERDIQVRGYTLRLPLDMLVVASANPEDYTNRGRIITPLKDRFGAEIRTHYPLTLDLEIALLRQEARIEAVIPEHLLDVVARFTRLVRESPAVDQRSGVSARFAIACVEEGLRCCPAAGRHRRGSGAGSAHRRPRRHRPLADGQGGVRRGPGGTRGRGPGTAGPAGHGRGLAAAARRQAHRAFLASLVQWFDAGHGLQTSDTASARSILDALSEGESIEGLGAMVTSVEPGMAESAGLVAACVEFAAEGLWLTRRIDKDDLGTGVRYGSASGESNPRALG
jgi:magnesium chelatase subunit I